MNRVVRKNIYTLEKMGFEVEGVPELDEIRIILRSKNKYGFAIYVDYDDMVNENIIMYIVSRFNSMITHKLELVE